MIRFGSKSKAPQIAAVAAALAAAAAVIWLVGPWRDGGSKGAADRGARAPAARDGRDAGGGRGAPAGPGGARPGGPDLAEDPPPAGAGGGRAPLPIEIRIEPGRRGLGPGPVPPEDPGAEGERAGMGGEGGAGVGGGEGAGGERTPELERARRDAWVDRQERRNKLRVDVIAAELGLDAERAKALGDAFDGALRQKIAFYETIDPKAVDQAALGARNDAIRSELEGRLLAVLGPKGYETYQTMEAEGRFFLPEEMKKPPPK